MTLQLVEPSSDHLKKRALGKFSTATASNPFKCWLKGIPRTLEPADDDNKYVDENVDNAGRHRSWPIFALTRCGTPGLWTHKYKDKAFYNSTLELLSTVPPYMKRCT